MCAFSTDTLDPTILDPRKRVRYATGLVLGVDEFLQDQTYLMERDQRHARTLHGYGTAHGLDVRARVREGTPELTVSPGLAVDSSGRDVCVPALQCARIDAWLADNADEVEAALGVGSFPEESPTDGTAELYVVLCHRECETDVVPLPGSPCRSEDDALAPSRISDRFDLRITATPPAAEEEAAVRRFGRLLGRFRVGDGAPTLTPDALADRVRALSGDDDGETGPLYLPAAAAADLVRLAFRVWTVEVRPALGGEGACNAPGDACVLLARLDLTVVADEEGYRLDGSAPAGPGGVPGVHVRQQGRPVLLTTRVLQEWLTLFDGPETGPGSFPDGPLVLNDLLDVDATPDDGDALVWDGGLNVWRAVSIGDGGGGGDDHGELNGLGDDDHPQYHTDARGDARYSPLGHTHAFPSLTDLDAGSDLDGLYPDPTVVGLQGRPVSSAAPSAGQVLRWTGTRWAPGDPSEGGEGHESDLVRIVGMNWAHDGRVTRDDLTVFLDDREIAGLVVAFGFEEPQDGAQVFVNDDSLDDQSFRLFREASDPEFPQAPDFYSLSGVRPGLDTEGGVLREVIPVALEDIGSPQWRVRRLPPTQPVHAALFPLTDQVIDFLQGQRLRVIIHGDAVVDREGRAIDAEFVRSDTATGDRPLGASRGTQGGRFESWFRFGFEEDGRVNPNRATVEELVALEGVGRARARRIVDAREGGVVFRSADDLVTEGGLPRSIADALADRLLFDDPRPPRRPDA